MSPALSPTPFVGIICGLKAEARALGDARDDPRLRVSATGASAERAAQTAERFVGEGVAGLISLGLAGGLKEDLIPGDLVLPEAVVTASGDRWPTDTSWRDQVLAAARTASFDVTTAQIAGSDDPVLTPADKVMLADRTGAVAVDMESHAVARVAAAHDLPFLALRVIGDGPGRAIPSAALAGVAPDGGTRPLAVLAALVRRPQDLPGLIGVARDSGRGLRALRGGLAHLLPALVGPRR